MVWDAYRRTTYRVLAPHGHIDLRVGDASPALDRLLDLHDVHTWAFVTAWNPQSMPLSASVNDARQRQLLAKIERHGWPSLPGLGIGDDASWRPEESVLVLGISRDDALQLARQFDQRAIVYGERRGVVELVAVTGGE